MFWALLGSYFVRAYRIYIYYVVNHGGISRLNKPYCDVLNRRVLCCLCSSAVLVFFFVVAGDWLVCRNYGLI